MNLVLFLFSAPLHYVSVLMHPLSQESTPRIVRIGDNPGCPCGGTHVADISDIVQIKV